MPNGEWELCWQISQARGKLPCSHSAQIVLQIASNHLRIIKKNIMILKALEKNQNQNSNSKNKTKNNPQTSPQKPNNLHKTKCFAKLVRFGETFRALLGSLSGRVTQFQDHFFSKNVSSSCQRKHRAVRVPTALPRAMHFANFWKVMLLLT